MKCTYCQEEGLTSSVRSHGGSRTLLGGGGVSWDEEGEYHDHDPNATTMLYTCSNNHCWTVKAYQPCPAEKCRVGKEEPVVRRAPDVDPKKVPR